MTEIQKIQKNPEFRKCTKLSISVKNCSYHKRVAWFLPKFTRKFKWNDQFWSKITYFFNDWLGPDWYHLWVNFRSICVQFQSEVTILSHKIQEMIIFSQKILISFSNFSYSSKCSAIFGEFWIVFGHVNKS